MKRGRSVVPAVGALSLASWTKVPARRPGKRENAARGARVERPGGALEGGTEDTERGLGGGSSATCEGRNEKRAGWCF